MLTISDKQLIDTIVDGLSNFIIAIGIKKIIDVIAVNEHLELYGRCTTKLEGVIDLKIETQKIKIEDQVGDEVERRFNAMNIGTQ